MNYEFQKMLKQTLFLLLFFSICALLPSCYSFKGISIPPSSKTFALPNIQVVATQADAITALQLTEKFKQKVLQTTRLTYNTETPDIEFTGSITAFGIQSIAPGANLQSQVSRFKMTVLMNYKNTKDDNPLTSERSQSFERFVDFDPSTQNFEAIRTTLVKQVNDLLVEDIYNWAFTNW